MSTDDKLPIKSGCGRFGSLMLHGAVEGVSRSFCSAAFLLLSFLVASAEMPHLIQRWEADQGLPENSANAMAQTPDGYLWFGTFNGLVRFDGVKFTVFDPSNTPELPSEAIVNLHLDQAGRLWLSTYRGIVVREGNRWTVLGEAQGWTGNFARSMSENAGVICITSFDGKVFRAEGMRLVELPAPPGIAGSGYHGCVDGAGKIWVGQTGFFGSWDGGQWVASPLSAILTNNFCGISRARDGGLLVLRGMTLYRTDGRRVDSATQLPRAPGPAWRVYEDKGGTVWLCTQNSGLLGVATDGTCVSYSATNGLGSENVRFAFEDRENNLWVGSSGGGLMRLKERTFFNPPLEVLRPTARVTAVIEEAPGKLLIGTYGGGYARLENGGVTRMVPKSARNLPRHVHCLLRDRRGDIWVGTYRNGVRIQRGDVLEVVEPADSAGTSVSALFEDSRGRIWIGGDQGVSMFAEGRFEPLTNAAGLRLGEVTSFAEQPVTGNIWAGNDFGVFQFAGNAWSEIKTSDGRSLDGTLCLKTESDGTLWIGGSRNVVSRWRKGRLSMVAISPEFPIRRASSFLDDGLGCWWIGSNRGVMRVNRAELDAAANDPRRPLKGEFFTMSDGMASVECTSGYQTTALKDSQGRLWFGTLKGISMVDPARLKLNTNPPPVHIERVTYRDGPGKSLDIDVTGLAEIAIPPGSRELGVHYAGLSYTAPEKMTFAYKIEGPNGQWQDSGGRRSIYFPAPTPGTLQLRIKASNNDGLWNETGASIALVIQPFFWQTLWFRVLALAVVFGSVGLVIRRNERARLRLRLERLEHERSLAGERARLATVTEATSDMVEFAYLDGRIFYINGAGRRMLGLGETEELDRRTIRDFHPSRSATVILNEAIAAVRKKGSWSGESILLRRNGCEVPVSQVVVGHKGLEGDIQFLSLISRDISEQKRTADALRKSEGGLRAFVDAIPDPSFLMEADGTLLMVNEAMGKSLGLTPHEIIGRNVYGLFPAEVAERRKAVIDEVIRTGTGSHFEDVNGGRQFINHVSVLPREAGQTARVAMLSLDVTDRKQTEDALSAIAQGVSAATGESYLRGVSEHLARVLGAEYAFVGELVAERPGWTRTIAAYAHGRVVENFEYDLKDTPCANVVGQRLCLHRSGVREMFPRDHLLVDMGVESYIGAPLFNGAGQAIGLMVVMFGRPMPNPELASSALQIFAARTAAELERRSAEEAVRHLTRDLEQRVGERTNELQRAVNLMAGREVRMGELKTRIREMEDELRSGGLSGAGAGQTTGDVFDEKGGEKLL